MQLHNVLQHRFAAVGQGSTAQRTQRQAVELGTNTLEATTVNALTVNADDVVCDLLTTSNLSFGGVVCKWNNAIQVCTRSATYYADTAWISYLDWDGNKKTMEVATGIPQAQSPSHRTISYIGPV